MFKAEIDQRVVRSKGDYVVGRKGTVIAIDADKKRAQVKWDGDSKTWVSFGVIEPESTPYEIEPSRTEKVRGITKHIHPKYRAVPLHL